MFHERALIFLSIFFFSAPLPARGERVAPSASLRAGSGRVRGATRDGVVTTVAGQPGRAGYWDGPAGDAMFTHPTWLDVVTAGDPRVCDEGDGGEIFVVDRMNGLVRHVAANGFVTTFRILNQQSQPVPLDFGGAFGGGVFVEPPHSGCGCGIYSRGVFLAASGSNQLVLASMSGKLASRDDWNPILGTGRSGSTDGRNADVEFRSPTGIVRVAPGPYTTWALYVADSGNHTIRKATYVLSFEGCPQTWTWTTFAGAAGQPGSADGVGGAARFNTPRGIAARPDGTLYVSDAGNHTIRKIAPDGTVTTIAGTPGVAGSDDTHLNTPSGIDVSASGEVFFVDTFNHAIRKIAADGKLVTVAGRLGVSGFADGDAAAAMFNAPVGLKIAPDGSLLVADTGNNVIRRVTLTR